MRRLVLIVVLAGMCQFAVPAPAYAWWGWFDQLSGAGPWKGYHVDLRIACFNDTRPVQPVPIAPARTQFPIGEPGDTRYQEAVEAYKVELAAYTAQAEQRMIRGAIGLEAGCPVDDDGYKRQSSVGIEFRLFHAEPDVRYAGNNEIRLVTLEPSFSRSLFRDPDWNVIDVGAAGGVYWFSSPGFRAINGIVLEPLRVDLHVPPFRNRPGSKPADAALAVAQMVVFRVGFVMFPRGFEANEFAANTRETARRLPSEWLFAKTVFLDFSPLFRLARN